MAGLVSHVTTQRSLVPEAQDEDSWTAESADPVFNRIQEKLSSARSSVCGSTLSLASEAATRDAGEVYAESFTHVPYGFQPRAAYHHQHGDIMSVSYNGRMRQFLLLDPKGVSLWNKDAIAEKDMVERPLEYPRYEYRLITSIVYARKYNVYFALGKDFALKVLNRDFQEICHVRSDLQSILFMIFNPVRDELITGGVAGARVWSYCQATDRMWTEIKHMANYHLVLKYELAGVGGSWVKRVDLDLEQQHLYCCSDTDLYAYDMEGKLIFKFERAHSMSITGSVYSAPAKQFLTVSADTEMKVWSPGGGLLHTFRGHARAISDVMTHPEDAMLVLTSSLDGTVRLWSLNTMDCLYSLQVSSEGVLWMGLTDDGLLYLSTLRTLTLWHLNTTHALWALARNRLTQLQLVPGKGKTTRVLSVGEDSSVRIFSRKSHKNLSTVLPPPALSPMQRAKCIVYNRVYSVVYMLLNSKQIWVYTTRTDPACRIAVWDVFGLQQEITLGLTGDGSVFVPPLGAPGSGGKLPAPTRHRATLYGTGKDGLAECVSLCYLDSPVCVWTEQEGFCCPLQHVYLLFGLADGRVLFMDPVVRAKKYLELRVSRAAVVEMRHCAASGCLLTRCDMVSSAHIQVWSLPSLQLAHLVTCSPDVTALIRINSTMVTGHTSGAVRVHQLLPFHDTGAITGTTQVDAADDPDESSSTSSTESARRDHAGPVLAIDACHHRDIFVSCSGDGVVRVWRENKALLREILLAESLCTVCFLDRQGALLCGFKNHIFTVPATKVCPDLDREDRHLVEEDSGEESDVYEDPAVLYEGVMENPDPISLDSYLVPFDIDFSKDFLVGKKPVVPPKEETAQDDGAGSEISAAPTEIYHSPRPPSPHRRSLLDLTLTAQPSAHELKMALRQLAPRPSSPGGGSKGVSFSGPPAGGVAGWVSRQAGEEGADEGEEAELWAVQFPRFGVSPGPTPSPSTPSCTTPSDFDVSEGGESTPVEDDEAAGSDQSARFTPIQPAEKATTSTTEVVTPKPIQADALPAVVAPRVSRASRLQNVRLDSRSLMSIAATPTAPPKTAATPAKGAEGCAQAEDHGHQQLAAQIKAERAAEASKKRQQNRESKAAKVSERRKKKQEQKREASRRKPEKAEAPPSSDESEPEQSREPPTAIKESRVQPTSKTSERRQARTILVDSSDESSDDSGGKKKSTTAKPGSSTSARPQVKAPALPSVPPPTETTPEVTSAQQIVTSSKRVVTSAHRGLLVGGITLDGAQQQDAAVGDESRDVIESGEALGERGESGEPGEEGATQGESEGAAVRPMSGVKVGFRDTSGVDDVRSVTSQRRLESAISTGRDSGHDELEWGSGWGGVYARSGSPTIYSDYGSEWTGADRPESRLAEWAALEPSALMLRMREELLGTPLSTASIPGRPNTPATDRGVQEGAAGGQTHSHTAFSFASRTEELEFLFMEALKSYQGVPGTADYITHLYDKAGSKFGGDYTDKLILRHQLLQLQRSLRAQSARERRHQQEERRVRESKQQPGHRGCHTPAGGGDGTLERLHEVQRVNQPPYSSPLPPHGVQASTQRSRRRPHTAAPGPHTAAPGPHTAAAFRAQSAAPSRSARPRTAPALSGARTSARSRATSAVSRAHTPQYAGATFSSGIPEGEALLRARRHVRPYRMSKSDLAAAAGGDPGKTQDGGQDGGGGGEEAEVVGGEAALRLLDPRHPLNRYLRPHSKSIPSKCSSYLLVSCARRPSAQAAVSPLEEQLILQRFPEWQEKWLGPVLKHQPRACLVPRVAYSPQPLR